MARACIAQVTVGFRAEGCGCHFSKAALHHLNTRPMRLYRASRRELFERLDRPALRPLPAEAFIVGEWHYDARVNIDYHVELHGHYYSVPHPSGVLPVLTVHTVDVSPASTATPHLAQDARSGPLSEVPPKIGFEPVRASS